MAVKRHRTHYDVTAENRTDAAMNAVERNMGKVNSAASRMGQTFRAVLGATVAAGLTREMARAAIEAEKSSNRLTAVLRATGGVAGVTRREIEGLVNSLTETSFFDDESIRNAAAEMTKFGNIHGEVFREGLRISADLASFMGTDMASAAQQVGRALQSPTEGITLLERHIGKLTDAEENHIRTLASQGRAVEAQNAVLEILQKRIGGTAELMNTGLTKATSDLGKAWGDLMEAVGAEGRIFNRTLAGAASLITDVRKEIEGTRTPLQDLAKDSINWLAVLRFLPGAISQIGVAAHNAQLEMDKRRRTVSGRIRNAGLEDAAALESGLAATPAVPITLGGSIVDPNKSKREAAAKRAAEFQEQLDVQAAMRSQLAADREAEFLKNMDKALDAQADRISLTHDEQQQVDQLAQKYQMAADREAEFTDPARLETMLESLKKVDDAALDLGFTFASAFEDAVLEAKKLSDVLAGLAKDIARIVLRKAVTEPVASAVTGALGGLFSGMGAGAGGNVPAFAMGTDSVPRTGLALVHQGEAIIPAGQNGGRGMTIVQHIAVSGATPLAVREQVATLMPSIAENARRAVFDAQARGR